MSDARCWSSGCRSATRSGWQHATSRRDPPGPLPVQQALGQRTQACLLRLDVAPLVIERLQPLGQAGALLPDLVRKRCEGTITLPGVGPQCVEHHRGVRG